MYSTFNNKLLFFFFIVFNFQYSNARAISQEFTVSSNNKNFGYFLRTNITGDYKQGRLFRWQPIKTLDYQEDTDMM